MLHSAWENFSRAGKIDSEHYLRCKLVVGNNICIFAYNIQWAQRDLELCSVCNSGTGLTCAAFFLNAGARLSRKCLGLGLEWHYLVYGRSAPFGINYGPLQGNAGSNNNNNANRYRPAT